MLHGQCKVNGVCILKFAIFYVVNAAALELQFACKILCSQLHCDYFERHKTGGFLRGVCSNVNIDDLRLFFELLLWNIDFYEFLFQAEYF